jgi:hypothetical protein
MAILLTTVLLTVTVRLSARALVVTDAHGLPILNVTVIVPARGRTLAILYPPCSLVQLV